MHSIFYSVSRGVGIALIPLVSVAVFAALSIYAGNTTEFGASFADVTLLVLPIVLGVAVIVGLVSSLLPSEARIRLEAILCALAVLIWIQANLLVWNYGVLDGSSINWLEGAWRGTLDSLVWAIVLWFAIFRFRQTHKLFLSGAVAILLIQVVAAGLLLSQDSSVLHKRSIVSNQDGKDALMRFSPTENVVHIVMDGFQSDIFVEILSEKSNPELQGELHGFTLFTQHLGAYPYTQLTVPALLSGQLYTNEQPVDEFVAATVSGNTITNAAIASGYEVDIAAPTALNAVYTLGAYSNAYAISPSNHVDDGDFARFEATKLMDLALFRSVPHFMKALVHRDELWVFRAARDEESYLQMQYFSDIAFLNDLAQGMRSDRDTPVYKLIHVMLSHRPFVADESCGFGGRMPESRLLVKRHAECGLAGVRALLQGMKDRGIYDNSLIVLMADHGAWSPIVDFAENETVSALTAAMATPVLAIKPPNATDPLQLSEAPTAITDLPASIAALTEIAGDFPGASVFELGSEDGRVRKHFLYPYGENPDVPGFLYPMNELLVDGDPFDSEAWSKGQRYVPSPD